MTDTHIRKFLNDVTTEGRQNRFIDSPAVMGRDCLIIADFSWWVENESQVLAWIARYGGIEQEGMLLWVDDQRVKTLFLLRWGQ